MWSGWWWWSRPAPVQEQVRDWRKQVCVQVRAVERDVARLQRTERETRAALSKYAREGRRAEAAPLARELVLVRRGVARLYETRGHLNSLVLQLGEQLARVRVTQTLAASAQAMHAMNSVMSVPQVARVMRSLAQEMYRAGFIEEMVADALDADADPDVEAQADEEVERVFDEILLQLDGGASAVTHEPGQEPVADSSPAREPGRQAQ